MREWISFQMLRQSAGGTDGARLSFKGRPCPNLGTGGYAFHGVYEHITVEGLDKAVVMVKDIVGMFAK